MCDSGYIMAVRVRSGIQASVVVRIVAIVSMMAVIRVIPIVRSVEVVPVEEGRFYNDQPRRVIVIPTEESRERIDRRAIIVRVTRT